MIKSQMYRFFETQYTDVVLIWMQLLYGMAIPRDWEYNIISVPCDDNTNYSHPILRHYCSGQLNSWYSHRTKGSDHYHSSPAGSYHSGSRAKH